MNERSELLAATDETIEDAGPPLELRWLPGTRIDLPVRIGS